MNSLRSCGYACICLATLLAADSQQMPASDTGQPAAIVPAEAEWFFLVVRPRSRRESYARFEFYLPSDEGTLVRAESESIVGAPIGGRLQARVLRPEKYTYLQEDVECFTGRILVDFEASQVPVMFLESKHHPDLGSLPYQASTSDTAMILGPSGRIEVVPSQLTAQRRQLVNRYFQQQQAHHEILINSMINNDYYAPGEVWPKEYYRDFWWLWPEKERDRSSRSNPLRRHSK